MNDFIVDDDGDYMSEDDSDEDWSSEDNDIRPRKSGVTIKELSDDSEPDEKSIVPVKAVSKDLKLPEKNGVAGTETEKVVKDAQKQVNGNGNLDHSNVVSSSEDEDGFRTKRKRKHKDMSNAQSVENDNESVPHVKPADRGSIDSNEGAVPVEEPVTDTDAKLSSKKKKKKKKKRSKESLEDGTGPLSKADADGSVSTSLKPIHREGDMKVVDDFRDASDGKKSGNKKGSVRKYPNGLQIENVKMGVPDGKQATPGKKVGMVYTGRLQSNNKIFDSNVGKKPFFFRLGVGEVIKGWDIGVNGMRVGDKRRLIIPPEMGYGSKGVPGIPPNSWLNFDVELVEVK
ncbi:hypothetical protein KP509_14G052500 [Ceratopteris richardii]|nr:hypothetical protein KP509_14G052500 [Ceratopteris richardii]